MLLTIEQLKNEVRICVRVLEERGEPLPHIPRVLQYSLASGLHFNYDWLGTPTLSRDDFNIVFSYPDLIVLFCNVLEHLIETCGEPPFYSQKAMNFLWVLYNIPFPPVTDNEHRTLLEESHQPPYDNSIGSSEREEHRSLSLRRSPSPMNDGQWTPYRGTYATLPSGYMGTHSRSPSPPRYKVVPGGAGLAPASYGGGGGGGGGGGYRSASPYRSSSPHDSCQAFRVTPSMFERRRVRPSNYRYVFWNFPLVATMMTNTVRRELRLLGDAMQDAIGEDLDYNSTDNSWEVNNDGTAILSAVIEEIGSYERAPFSHSVTSLSYTGLFSYTRSGELLEGNLKSRNLLLRYFFILYYVLEVPLPSRLTPGEVLYWIMGVGTLPPEPDMRAGALPPGPDRGGGCTIM